MKSEENLKDKTVSGMMWGAVGKVGTLTINFLSNLVLARLLMPEDFDCIGMLAIFLAVSNIFIQGGLGAALIQKKNPSRLDYSTVFYWNLVFAVVFYLLLFAMAPAVARFYGLPILQPMLRVQSSVLIIQSFAIVQITQLQKQMNFKALAIRNMAAALAGTLTAIPMACRRSKRNWMPAQSAKSVTWNPPSSPAAGRIPISACRRKPAAARCMISAATR